MRLDVIDYYYPIMSCAANPRYEDSEDLIHLSPDPNTDFSIDFDKKLLTVNLVLDSRFPEKDDEDYHQPYSVLVQVVGVFSIAGDDNEESFSSRQGAKFLIGVVLKNAAALLYSATREYVHTITAKGPYGRAALGAAYFDQEQIFENCQASLENEGDLIEQFEKAGLIKLVDTEQDVDLGL